MYSKIILFLLLPIFAFSQAPQKINFQSILRNTNGEVVANKSVSLKISILSGSISGLTVYNETHTKTTDISGLISLQIGAGTVLSGVFANIGWGNAPHFIKLEVDFSGGSNYVLLGTQELMSVPYALYASKTDTSALNLTSRLATKLNVTDTTSLSNRIDTKSSLSDTSLLNLTNRFSSKVNITDTSSMLNPYLRKADAIVSVEADPVFNSSIAKGITGIDTAYWNRKLNLSDTSNMLANYRIRLNNKVNILDTVSMLQAYLRHADTTGMLFPYLRYADTTNMLANYLTGINAKVNITDTSDMLNPYLRKANAIGSVETDPVFNNSIAKGITGIDTAYWNRKVNISDTSNMLANYRTGLNEKVNIADTSNMLSNYRTELNNKVNVSDTSNMLSNYRTGLNAKAPIYNPTFIGTVSGIDKNMVGLGNVNNTSDVNKPISTATQTALNNKVNVSDTSSMLANYRTGLNEKVNIADTSSMLNPYLRKADAIGSVETDPVFNSSIAKGITEIDTAYWNRKLNLSDTSNMLANYRTGLNQKVNVSDTASMLANYQTRLNQKVNVSDTSDMMANYRTRLNNKVNVSDTSNMLSNYRTGLNNKVNITDTSSMLNPYLRKADAIGSVETDPVFNTSIAKGITGIDTAYWNRKLNLSDTSNMLANYRTELNNKVNVSDTASMLANYQTGLNQKVNVSDTSDMLTNYRTGLNNKVNVSDTSNMLSNYRTGLNIKVNIADTSDMLNPYLRKADAIGSVETDPVFNSSIAKGITGIDTAYWNRKLNLSDTSNMLANYRTGLNNKVNVSDTASMLANYLTGINAKVNITDTSDMLNPYLRKADAITSGSVETDPVFNVSVAKGITGIDTAYWNRKLNIADFPLGTTLGNIQYWNGTNWVNLAPGQNGQTLILTNGIPSWSGAAYPTLTTSSLSSITSTSVNGGGNISSDGGAAVSARGLVYATTSNPTLSNTILTIGSGTGSFSGSITGLTPNTTYYLRAYATNSSGTGYGNEVIFQTLPVAVPTLVTTDASGITQTTVTSGGTISNDGGATITERGIVYGTSTNPTTSNTKVTSGSGTGSFSVNVTAITPNTNYHIRSYAINSAGTGYGNNITFQTTVPTVPSLTTRELLNITNTTATGGGSITNDGGSSITAKGICWGTSPNPTTVDSKTTDGMGTTTFTSFITGLSASVTYYVRAYATNSTGTGYGNQQTFTTSSTSNTLPVVTSTSVTGLTTIQATFNSEVNSQGGGTVTERGAVWNTSGNPTVNNNRIPSGSGTGVYTTTLTGLNGGSNNFARAYAINNFGISYGIEIPFTTLSGLATLTTNNVISQSTTASSGGNISDNGGSAITARGVVWNTTGTPTISDNKTTDGSGTGSYVSNLTAVNPSTTYYLRAYATNSTGTAYGNELSFTSMTSPLIGNVTDIDGNTYNTVQISNQVWMSENLKTTRYRQGGPIPYVVGNAEWQALTTGAWSYYNHDEANNTVYGKLYNWYTTLGDTLCPTGWHVPSDAEWTVLTTYLGGESVAGDKMKSIGTTYWNDPNTGATNESGFSALPSGGRSSDGGFGGNFSATFWSATEIDAGYGLYAIFRSLANGSSYVTGNVAPFPNKQLGFAVRCLKDQLPSLTTTNVNPVTSNGARSGGNISYNGGSTITARGIIWSTTGNPTINDSKTTDELATDTYVSYMIGLSPNTTYYVRAYATNNVGTAFGNQHSFTTPQTLTDIDGNIYNTVQVGSQFWMNENLKTTRYRNGGLIQNIVGNGRDTIITSAWCFYNHDELNNSVYGKLYNWYTTIGDTLCPIGWHVPSDSEWTTLTSYLGGESVAGGKMKSIGTSYWNSPNTGATNESSFSVLPGGDVYSAYYFSGIRNYGRFWSTSEAGIYSAWFRELTYNNSNVNRYYAPKYSGRSVRCLKD